MQGKLENTSVQQNVFFALIFSASGLAFLGHAFSFFFFFQKDAREGTSESHQARLDTMLFRLVSFLASVIAFSHVFFFST
jgi:hypothetical protein